MFCSSCGKNCGEGEPLCDCTEQGYCTKCGAKMSSEKKCEVCSNAYTFITKCECIVNNITVECTVCGVDTVPLTKKEFNEYCSGISRETKEVGKKYGSLKQKGVALKRLNEDVNGVRCKCECTLNYDCGKCYISW